MATVTIRAYDPPRDADAVRALIIELQDDERALEPRLPRGIDAVDPYLEQLFAYCRERAGHVVVAEEDGRVVGMAGVMTRVIRDDPTEPSEDFAYVSDLVVAREHRAKGVGRALVDRTIELARANGARTLEIGVLSKNHGAMRLYEARGFAPFQLRMTMDLGAP